MISELVALASCVMLTAAQFRIPAQQVAALPNLQPIQLTSLPDSQILMMQSANSILNSDTGSPLSPGILGGAPVLVSETAQSILDQESRIVGYNLPDHFFQQQQHPYAQQSEFIPVNTQTQIVLPSRPLPTAAQNVAQPSQGRRPRHQSLNVPLLNQRQENVVPVRAMASLEDFMGSKGLSDSVSHVQNVAEEKQPTYYDIPPDHPLPPPPSSTPPQPTEYHSSSRHSEQRRQESPFNPKRGHEFTRHQNYRERLNHKVNSNDEGAYLTPPSPNNNNEDAYLTPPSPNNRDFFRTELNEDSSSASHHTSRSQQLQNSQDNRERENSQSSRVPTPPSQEQPHNAKPREGSDKSQRRKRLKNRQSKSGSTKSKATSPESQTKIKPKINDNDSATDGSETSFLTALLNQYQPAVPPPPSYQNNNNFQNGGYASNDHEGPVVHKHIFVHAAPETYPQSPRVRVVRPHIKQEQHVNIIFVKTPTEAPPTQTIVELPPQHQQKTLVYILSKKHEDTSGKVKVVSPRVPKPPAPEIYFIRYGERRENKGYPVPNLESLHLNDNNLANHQPVGIGAPDSLPFLRNKRHKDYGSVYAPLMAYSTTGQINEITNDEADLRKSNLDAFF